MKHLSVYIAAVAAMIILASCASAPKPVASSVPSPTPAAQQPAGQAPVAATPAPTAQLKRAQELQAEDQQYGLDKRVPDAYAQGVNALNAGQAAMGSDNATAATKLNEAITDFQTVYDTGFASLAAERQADAVNARKMALAAKADKAVPGQFSKAEALMVHAQQRQSAGSSRDAYDLYTHARDLYLAAAQSADASRAAAEQALAAANRQLDQTKAQVETIQQSLTSSTGSGAGGQ